jgi:DNA-directed RNA polymerase subunit beta
MGCNMQRQAVLLLKAESPSSGPAWKARPPRIPACSCSSRRTVISVSGEQIVVDPGGTKETLDDYSDYEGMDEYPLLKFKRSNQDTCINQKPLVHVGDKVKANQVLADGPATEDGELALGMNVIVAFMPWLATTTDAIVCSERSQRRQVHVAAHRVQCQVRDTKAGMEEIAKSRTSAKRLSRTSTKTVSCALARVRSGDILVGKVTPKGETESPESASSAIFGERPATRDASSSASGHGRHRGRHRSVLAQGTRRQVAQSDKVRLAKLKRSATRTSSASSNAQEQARVPRSTRRAKLSTPRPAKHRQAGRKITEDS